MAETGTSSLATSIASFRGSLIHFRNLLRTMYNHLVAALMHLSTVYRLSRPVYSAVYGTVYEAVPRAGLVRVHKDCPDR